MIVNSCGAGPTSKWPKVKAVAAHGHEVINHSLSFACLARRPCGARRSTLDFATEIDQATALLQQNVGAPVTYFVFPFDACGPEAVAHLRQRGYLGARCGIRGISEPGFPDGFATRYDVWGPAFSIYGTSGPCKGIVLPNTNTPLSALPVACRRYVLDQYVDDAITQKGWAIRTLAGFVGDPGAFQPIDVADYVAHLNYVGQKAALGQLWVEGPSRILKYRWAREKCALPTVEGDTLRFPEPTAECRSYATTLSYLVRSRDGGTIPNLKVTQGDTVRTVKPLELGLYLVDADPTRGDARLTP